MNLVDTNLSRTTSRASARSKNSTLSRNQSLIKKNIELQDLRPADVLIERFVAWKAIVKQLTAYFEVILVLFPLIKALAQIS
jgi:adenine-specific DNA glycosylase